MAFPVLSVIVFTPARGGDDHPDDPRPAKNGGARCGPGRRNLCLVDYHCGFTSNI